ncbi:MAG TPA: S8 family peptidase [Gemmatimonadaceae bacterium]|nr:S8 family peptidase [Gemmatimonadaceae bacterium]
MKSLRIIQFAVLAASTACASGKTVTETPAPAPTPVATTPPPAQPAATNPAPPPPVRLTEAPRDWQLLDATSDRVVGVSARRAERELLAGKQPKRTVVVAVIDGGIDTAHVGLKANLWSNPKEIAGNGKDDDNNGYADDVRGWNFIGGKNGDVQYDALELTRLYARCTKQAPGSAAKLPVPDAATCKRASDEFEKQKAETQQLAQQVEQISVVMTRANDIMRRALGTDSLTKAKVAAYSPTSSETQQAKMMWLKLADAGITPEELNKAKEEVESKTKYGLNPQYDPRTIVGDDYSNTAERKYGNADVMGPDARHGTHVSGIIGGVRGTTGGIDGIATNVKLMMIRTVPDGDERDKDIANAIRYAVDNGANIVNMSFGKGFSPEKGAVDEAVKYADSKGVLLVHAAGNDGENLAEKPSFPTPAYTGGGKPNNWLEVGASSWKGLDSLAASFSNYGKAQVDIFAPGVDILSTVPGGGYERESGTSMAAPVVSGVAAMLMSYFPTLSAADVKRILIDSSTRYADQKVVRPGAQNGEQVPFGSLSITGGVVNAYAAVKLAEQMSATKP